MVVYLCGLSYMERVVVMALQTRHVHSNAIVQTLAWPTGIDSDRSPLSQRLGVRPDALVSGIQN